jgi:hypothetical protein
MGCAVFCVILLLVGIVLIATVASAFNPFNHLPGGGFPGGGGTPPAGAIYGGNNAVTLAAKAMAAHLNLNCLKYDPNPDCLGDASFDNGFPGSILNWGLSHCPGCLAWMNNHFQCVSFVLGAYGLFHPLDLSGNGSDFFGLYSSSYAASLGYRELLPARGQLPVTPGDIMAWNGGAHGHVSIVLGWIPPSGGQNGWLTFAQANGEMPIQTLPILPDGTISTNDGYWNGFTVMAYIHPPWLPIVPGYIPVPSPGVGAGTLPNSPYVPVARLDAQQAGIDANIYLRQINQESGFNVNAVSKAGAIGIAQFMPATAAGLGIDPHDPIASLRAAAAMMAGLLGTYRDYAKALAAYNAGSGAVNQALGCGARWLSCLPQETQDYVHAIMNY